MFNQQVVRDAASGIAKEFHLSASDASDFIALAEEKQKQMSRELMHFIAVKSKSADGVTYET